MNKAGVNCPSCGSDKVAVTTENKSVTIPFAPTRTYEARIDVCSECGMRGDFLKVNEAILAEALSESRKASAISMMNHLVESGLGMAHMERVLELSPRTMMRWKTGECSAGALALLRIVTTYPWTLDVADAQFDPQYAAKRLAQEGVKALCGIAESHQLATEVDVTSFDKNGIQGTYSVRTTNVVGSVADEKKTRANWLGPVKVLRMPCTA